MPLQLEHRIAAATEAQLEFDNLFAMAKIHRGRATLKIEGDEKVITVTPSADSKPFHESFSYSEPIEPLACEETQRSRNEYLLHHAHEYFLKLSSSESAIAVPLQLSQAESVCG